MKKVLVAGATGYLGKFVVKELKKQGYYVRALARNPQKLEKEGKYLEPPVKKFIDEIFIGEITKPDTLKNLLNNIDIIFSSIGKTRQKDKLSFEDVDYKGNKNLLDMAIEEGIKKFIYISVFKGNEYQHLSVAKAKEKFVKELKSSGLDYSIIRPTGFFSDMSEFFSMAKSGLAFLIGDGNSKINPIHGEDLAKFCVDTIKQSKSELDVGGAYVYSYNEIINLAFSILEKHPRIIHIPKSIVKLSIPFIKKLHKQSGDIIEFFLTSMTNNLVAPKYGSHKLEDYFIELMKKN